VSGTLEEIVRTYILRAIFHSYINLTLEGLFFQRCKPVSRFSIREILSDLSLYSATLSVDTRISSTSQYE